MEEGERIEEQHDSNSRAAAKANKRKSLGFGGAKKALRKLFSSKARLPADGRSWAGASSAGRLLDDADGAEGGARENGKADRASSLNLHLETALVNHQRNRDDSIATNTATATTTTTQSVHLDIDSKDMPANSLPLKLQTYQASKEQRPQSAAQPPNETFENKENVPPEGEVDGITRSVSNLKIDGVVNTAIANSLVAEEVTLALDPEVVAERAEHSRFIGEALDMARLALRINETPVGCVLVHKGKVIAKGMNATNVTRNGTRHAEFMAINALLAYPRKSGPVNSRLKPKEVTDKEALDALAERERLAEEAAEAAEAAEVAETTETTQATEAIEVTMEQLALTDPETAASEKGLIAAVPEKAAEAVSYDPKPHEGNEDGKKSHLYPYGQKIMDTPRVDRSIIRDCILYVTVEPCIMCASLLRQLGIKKVYFGAVNDKFGGTGGVFSIHANSLPVRADGQTASSHPTLRPIALPDGTGGTLGVSFPPGGGDGGNVEQGFEIEGGWGRDEAVALLRRFYVQENGRAPVPRKKEGRAARLAAMMEKDGDVTITPGDDAGLSTGDETPISSDDVRQSMESEYGNVSSSETPTVADESDGFLQY